MKQSDQFMLKEVADQSVLVPIGDKALDFNGIITLNEVGKLIWENMQEETDIDTLANLLVEKYNIDKSLAKHDIEKFIDSLREDGCIDE